MFRNVCCCFFPQATNPALNAPNSNTYLVNVDGIKKQIIADKNGAVEARYAFCMSEALKLADNNIEFAKIKFKTLLTTDSELAHFANQHALTHGIMREINHSKTRADLYTAMSKTFITTTGKPQLNIEDNKGDDETYLNTLQLYLARSSPNAEAESTFTTTMQSTTTFKI